MQKVHSYAEKMDEFVMRIGDLPNAVAAHQQQSHGSEPGPGLVAYLGTLLNQQPLEEAQSVYIAFEHKNWQDNNAMIRVDRQSWPNAAVLGYDYHDPKREWYSGAKSTGEPYISEPFFDAIRSKMTLVSISKPVYDERGGLIGVAGADIPIERMRTIVANIRLRPPRPGLALGNIAQEGREYGFMVSRGGRPIAHPNESLLLAGTDAGEDVTNPEDLRDVIARPEGFATARMSGIARRVYWATAPMTGWKIALNVPEAAILFPVRVLAVRVTLIGVLAFLLMIAAVTVVARRLAGPLRQLTAATANVETEDYHAVQLDDIAGRSDELGQLARGFQRMVREVDARQQRLKQAEEALRQSEQHFRSLIEHASDVITILDASGMVLYESPSVERALGYAPEDLIGRRFFEYLHPQGTSPGLCPLSAPPPPKGGARRPLSFRSTPGPGVWAPPQAIPPNPLPDPGVNGTLPNPPYPRKQPGPRPRRPQGKPRKAPTMPRASSWPT